MSEFPEKLLSGYRNFMSGRYSDERERYRALADTGQKPHTLLVACCDSRAAPETIFDCGPGELFVVRNVANMVPRYEPDSQFHGTSAAVEYAVQVLEIRNIVVMGHGRCGGIQAALDASMKPLSEGDFIGKWMGLVRPAATQIQSNDLMTQSERQTALERVSIRNSIANLQTFPFVRNLTEKGELDIHGAWFDISTGELWVMNEKGDFTRPDISVPAIEAEQSPA
ncbi:carbonate dehydratase [Rhizobium sp. Leaf306]|jgi:carbonic anhydrase|uniref:Carbonic anhydrase n=1 Tax=Rhizobium soli TaxID=424798 RepID=A0A7X0MT47_9HYPH|nr:MULTISPECIES: carbonic anhydrase [Rhizobium]RYE66927.1 MAG: carbonic anhydrase [Rhizobiaceae bacterium]KQQ33951.1 carbonate dehydratase [Rhizobium sp. Leaf306]KQQ78489.1 carbonate dehydratase [Rhizobium sp. Leaf321]MBB6510379.1 carbonic anhydrase [Rhizobium soli]SEH31300.1 carbonic anhydrase [Rhizobium sp. NFR12]